MFLLYAARAALALSAVLTVVFDPRVFFGASGGGGGWISFSSAYHGGAWWAFRLAVAALALYGVAAAFGDARVGWRGPALAAALVAWALLRGVPHATNASRWGAGAVGAREWLRAERAERARTARPIDAAAFAGDWAASDGTTWRFGATTAERVVPPGADAPSVTRARCSGAYRVAYEERGRDALADYGVEAFPHAAAVLRAMPPNVRLAFARVQCAEEPWGAEFVRVGDGELWLLEQWATPDELRSGAFVLRRAGAR